MGARLDHNSRAVRARQSVLHFDLLYGHVAVRVDLHENVLVSEDGIVENGFPVDYYLDRTGPRSLFSGDSKRLAGFDGALPVATLRTDDDLTRIPRCDSHRNNDRAFADRIVPHSIVAVGPADDVPVTIGHAVGERVPVSTGVGSGLPAPVGTGPGDSVSVASSAPVSEQPVSGTETATTVRNSRLFTF
jgi:hypothetical protein